jgi:hypothetical protein
VGTRGATKKMTETLDRTTAAAPSAVVPADDGQAALVVDDAVEHVRRLPSGWYVLGLAVQVFLWFLVFLGIAVAIGVGGHLTEFRYVGF